MMDTGITDTSITDTSVIAKQLPSIAQAPSLCRLCNVKLLGLQTWRAHVKSDMHVYKLQLKVAEPGSVTLLSPPSADGKRTKSASPPACARRRNKPGASLDHDESDDCDTEYEPSAPTFAPGKCLFCPQESGILDDNMTHMAAAHSFSVPFQDCLAVDLETVIWYLHFVIHGYRECICCGTRRNTVEGVLQHMVAKGHCRFDVSSDTEDFYEMPQSKNALVEQTQRDDSMPVRLPSGKLISHRKSSDTHEPRAPRRATPDRSTESFASRLKAPATPGLEIAQRREGSGSGEIVRSSEALLAAQLSKLKIASDRVQHKEEERKRGRLERANNSILFKHYRLDSGDSRIGRQF
ncbi:hypothetical protein QQS21_011411 [Conoideocrella luteorostrata]|uniref:ZN622/Rei1/Reh1 zinc finger C2H2-type domain-containing protein n=1 Tax=Conoideocrella luteorostrata TaxID=1105319 RepID=A0AAJ0CFX6_9HYPO|nr:hypothetical protein QQS21_011411 [Conoideocrella luteorostrata]